MLSLSFSTHAAFALSSFQGVTAASDGLTLSEVVANLPRDPASIFVMLLVLASLIAIVWFGGSHGPKPPQGQA